MNTLSSFFRSDKGRKRTPYKQRDDKITAKGLGKSFLAGGGFGSMSVPMAQGLIPNKGKGLGNALHNSRKAGLMVIGQGLAGMGIYTGNKLYNKIKNRNKKQYE